MKWASVTRLSADDGAIRLVCSPITVRNVAKLRIILTSSKKPCHIIIILNYYCSLQRVPLGLEKTPTVARYEISNHDSPLRTYFPSFPRNAMVAVFSHLNDLF